MGSSLKLLTAVVTACAALGSAMAQDRTESERAYYVIEDRDGVRLGHASAWTESSADGGRRAIDRHEYYLHEQGGAAARIVSEAVLTESASGEVISIVETSRRDRVETRVAAHIDGARAEITRQTPAGRWTQTITLPPNVHFDSGEALLRTWSGDAPLDFDNFSIDAMAVERIVIEPLSRLASGGMVAMRRRYAGDQMRGLAQLTIDAEGRVVEVVQPMVGMAVHIRSVDRATARAPHAPYAVVRNSMVRSPFAISVAARAGRIRYRFAFEHAFTFAPPQTGEQSVSLAEAAAIVEICDGCGPGLATDPATLADALRPTAWLQSDHPRLLSIAAPVARLNVSDARKMEVLIERARPYLGTLDFNGHYSALDTIIRRAGDCTEAAVLLAALGRAAGIPTRVVSGLTYSRASYHGVSNAFMPHSWTLAYVDGQWRSFDLALDAFDSTHIALTIGDGDASSIAAASQLASLLRFDAMTEVRSRR